MSNLLIKTLEKGEPIPPSTDPWRVERAREILIEWWMGPRTALWNMDSKRRRRVLTAVMINRCSEFLGDDLLDLPRGWDRGSADQGLQNMKRALMIAGLI